MYWCVWELINVTRARIGEEYYSVFIVETRGELQRLKIFFAKKCVFKNLIDESNGNYFTEKKVHREDRRFRIIVPSNST